MAQTGTDEGHDRGAPVRLVHRHLGNRARNNIQESLKDLGPDTPYAAGEPIAPDETLAAEQVQAAARLGVHAGQGLRVARRAPGRGARCPSSPARSSAGHHDAGLASRCSTATATTPARRSRAPTTIELTRSRPSSPRKRTSLWIQGGTPTDPVLDRSTRAVRVRRAALRDRQPQRRQRRVDRLPAGREARLLLRLLRRAAADERHDHRAQGRRRPAAEHARHLPVHGQHLVQRRRILRALRRAR